MWRKKCLQAFLNRTLRVFKSTDFNLSKPMYLLGPIGGSILVSPSYNKFFKASVKGGSKEELGRISRITGAYYHVYWKFTFWFWMLLMVLFDLSESTVIIINKNKWRKAKRDSVWQALLDIHKAVKNIAFFIWNSVMLTWKF